MIEAVFRMVLFGRWFSLMDLELAKKRMEDAALTLCIARDGKVIFAGASRGISGFLDAVKSLGGTLEGASVADRVVTLPTHRFVTEKDRIAICSLLTRLLNEEGPSCLN